MPGSGETYLAFFHPKEYNYINVGSILLFEIYSATCIINLLKPPYIIKFNKGKCNIS